MNTNIKGVAFKFKDNINTDYIISSRRKRDTLDMNILKQYLMEDIRPGFFKELKKDSILVGGENFGCGSAMEVAVQIVKAAGIKAIIAKSFARSYYRNCINNGIVVIEMDTNLISEGDIVDISFVQDNIIIHNETTGTKTKMLGYTDKIKDIIMSGGIMGNLEKIMK